VNQYIMKKIEIEKEPKLQFNRGNPDSPVPPGRNDQDAIEDNAKQIEGDTKGEDSNKAGGKKKKFRDNKKIKGNKTENTELLTF
jgi:hypothetical protein